LIKKFINSLLVSINAVPILLSKNVADVRFKRLFVNISVPNLVPGNTTAPYNIHGVALVYTWFSVNFY